MVTTLVSIFLILATVLGGSGITVAAAQSSLPGDFLYPVKTLSEDAFYQLTLGDQDRLNLALDFADRRLAEIQDLLDVGQVPPDAVQLRLQTHLQTALELSVKDMSVADELLEQTRSRMQETLTNRLVQANPDPTGEAVRLQVRDMLQVRISWVEDGLEQLSMLNTQTQNQQQTQQQEQPGQNGEVPGSANGVGQDAGQMPNYQYGSGEWAWNWMWMTTPTPLDMEYQYQYGNGGQGGSGQGAGK